MESWTQEFVDLHEPGFFEFDEHGLGSFVFGTISGAMDVRAAEAESMLEFSWLGGSEDKQLLGRGYFIFSDPDEGVGTFYIHTGGESGVAICRDE